MNIRTLTWIEMNIGIATLTAGLFLIFGPWALVTLGGMISFAMLIFGNLDGKE